MHVWRQTQTQSNIVNFYEEGMNIFNPTRNERGNSDGIFRMEFPLMQWLVACFYKVFGNHILITRLCMFLISIFSILGIYSLLKSLFNKDRLALIGAWAFTFSPSFFYHSINPLPDNLAMCFAIWGLAFFFKWEKNNQLHVIILSGFILSLSVLCKLPFIIYYVVPFVYFLLKWKIKSINLKFVLDFVSCFIFSILPISWYAYVIPSWGGNIIVKGVIEKHDSILKYALFDISSNLPELILNYGSVLFFLAGFYFIIKLKTYLNEKFKILFMLSIGVLVYYFFEITAIANVHDYYLFPFFPLIFILVAYGAENLLNIKNVKLKYLVYFLLFSLPILCLIRMQSRWNYDSPGFNKDILIYKNELKNAIPKSSLVVVGNDESHYILFYYLDKKGWCFDNDNLTEKSLIEMIEKGAEYIYSDSRKVDEDSTVLKHIDNFILQKGTIKLYSLKK